MQSSVSGARTALELACGTGIWTTLLAQHVRSVTALDASPQMLAIARTKVRRPGVDFLQADIFAWEPTETYDVCFFGFWLSHVPLALMPAFWAKLARALEPGGRVCFVDSARSELASASDHRPQDASEELMLRRLDDGREFHVVKHWFEARALAEMLSELGWSATVSSSGEFFVHGEAAPKR